MLITNIEERLLMEGNTGKLKLRHVRSSLRLTQKQLAKEAGVSEPAIIDIEKGRVSPRLTTAYAIIDALNKRLQEKGRQILDVNSLDWKLQGEN